MKDIFFSLSISKIKKNEAFSGIKKITENFKSNSLNKTKPPFLRLFKKNVSNMLPEVKEQRCSYGKLTEKSIDHTSVSTRVFSLNFISGQFWLAFFTSQKLAPWIQVVNFDKHFLLIKTLPRHRSNYHTFRYLDICIFEI